MYIMYIYVWPAFSRKMKREKQEDQKLMDFNNDIESDPTYLYASILHLPMKFLSP